MAEDSTHHFQELLERLAAEHHRGISELQAEIARLNGFLDDRALGSEEPCGEEPTNLRVFPQIREDWPQQKQGLCSSRDRDPDEGALAAAFAVATDIGSEGELTVGSDPGTAKKLGTSTVHQEDPEALALWAELLEDSRKKVETEGLPKVHSKWNIDCKADLGYKMKNLVVHRRSMAGAFLQHHKKNLEQEANSHTQSLLTSIVRTVMPQIPTHPSSKARLSWDLIGILLLVHDLVMIPMSMFNNELTGYPQEYENFLGIFDYFTASFWSIDILINFFTGFHTTSGFVEMHVNAIAKNYLRTWFPLDICIVTIDWTMTLINQGGPTDFMRLGKTFSRLTRLVRLLRFMKMNKHMSEMLSRINSEYVLTLIGLVRLVVGIVIVNHYIACFWYGISRSIEGPEETWVNYYLIRLGKYGLSYSYFTSLHWSLTQFTPASMEVFPHNAYERAFNVVVIIAGFVIFSSFVSSITGAMNHIRNINARAVEQDSMIRQFFSENNIPHGLASRVWLFVRQKRVLGKRLKQEELPILQQLPVRLRDELRQEVCTPHLNSHPLLRLYSRLCPAAIKKVCLKAVEEKSLLSGKELKFDHECINKMIFVLIGGLEYHIVGEDDVDPECARVDRGGWACEAALWADQATIEGHFVAAPGGADLLLLDAENFRTIAAEFPDTTDVLVRYSSLFMERFTAAMLDDEAVQKNVLFNSPEAAKDMARAAEGGQEGPVGTGLPLIRQRTSLQSADKFATELESLDETRPISIQQQGSVEMPVLTADRDEVNSPAADETNAEEQSSRPVEVNIASHPDLNVREFREQSI